MATPLLALEAVCATDPSGFETLLQDISFTVAAGDRLGIAGPSGAGKSTLLRLLNRLRESSGGRLIYEGNPLSSYPVTELRRQIVLVPQEPKLLGMTVEASLRYPLQLQKLPSGEIERRLRDTWEFWELPAEWGDRTELNLSVGQRQRVTIARGMMLQPRLLLLDEPTSALDATLAQQVIERLIQLNQQTGLSIIMVNHQPQHLRQFAQRILHLADGRIQREEPL